MKKYFYLASLLLLSVISCSKSSESKPDIDEGLIFVGTWRLSTDEDNFGNFINNSYDENKHEFYIEFNSPDDEFEEGARGEGQYYIVDKTTGAELSGFNKEVTYVNAHINERNGNTELLININRGTLFYCGASHPSANVIKLNAVTQDRLSSYNTTWQRVNP